MRDQLIELEIRARCEEWRIGEVHAPATCRALRRLQMALHRGIWALGVRAALQSGAGQDRAVDGQLMSMLHELAGALHHGAGNDHALAEVAAELRSVAEALNKS